MFASRLLSLIFAICIVLLLAGCIQETNPLTGEKTTRLDPNNPVIPAAEGAVGFASALLPLLGPIGGAGATVLAAALAYWGKIKPQLTQSQAEAQQGYTAGTALVDALDEYKKMHPTEWSTLGTLIQKNLDKFGVDAKAAENFIRGIRGLPPRA
jgi:hypothetical protein